MIQIKYDCPISVDDLSNDNGSHYCNSCQKSILDFRGKSLTEIHVIQEENPQSNCGIFDAKTARIDLKSWTRNVFRIAFAAVFVLGLNSSVLFGQSIDQSSDSIRVEQTLSQEASLTGVVLDSKGRPQKAKIQYEVEGEAGFVLSFETNKDGVFDIDLPRDAIGKIVRITVILDGHYHKYLTINQLASQCYLLEVKMEKAQKVKYRRRGRSHALGFY